MKEKLIKTILDNVDGDLRIVNLQKLTDDILDLLKVKTDWAGLDPEKWGELEYVTNVSQKGHWEEDDIGKISIDEEE